MHTVTQEESIQIALGLKSEYTVVVYTRLHINDNHWRTSYIQEQDKFFVCSSKEEAEEEARKYYKFDKFEVGRIVKFQAFQIGRCVRNISGR